MIVRPSDFAVLPLMTGSNLVGCSTGRSIGFARLKILSTWVARRLSCCRGGHWPPAATARKEHAPRNPQRKCTTIFFMKTATIPSVRVEPELRAEVESLLGEGETDSEFVEASVRATVMRRRNQAEFVARGLRSADDARRSGDYVDADTVLQKLQRKLDAARMRKPATRR